MRRLLLIVPVIVLMFVLPGAAFADSDALWSSARDACTPTTAGMTPGAHAVLVMPLAAVDSTPEFTVCTAAGEQWLPAISGNRIVWEDWRNAGTTGADIYLYDLATQEERPICTALGDQTQPAISGDTIVWTDGRLMDGTNRIYLYDLVSSQERRLTATESDQGQPAISGTRVAWTDGRNRAASGFDIYSYSLATAKERAVCRVRGDQGEPAISGTRVVWTDNRISGSFDIYTFNLATGKGRAICTARREQSMPSISGKRIVWMDGRKGTGVGKLDIYSFDLGTGHERALCTAPGYQGEPAISGSRVVFRDSRGQEAWTSDIGLYDLAIGAFGWACRAGYNQTQPAIDGSTVVWPDGRADWYNHDIYGRSLLGDLFPPVTVAEISGTSHALGGVTYVNHPVTVTFSATDKGGSGVAQVDYQVSSSGSFETGTGTQVKIGAPADHTGDDAYAFEYRATDTAGNAEDYKKLRIVIDTTGPTTSAPVPAVAARGKTAYLKYEVTDWPPGFGTAPGVARVTLKIRNRGGVLVKVLPLGMKAINTPNNPPARFAVPPTWRPGKYRFYVFARDWAGNTQAAPVGSNTLTIR